VWGRSIGVSVAGRSGAPQFSNAITNWEFSRGAELVAIAGEDLGFHRVNDLLDSSSNPQREFLGAFGDDADLRAHLPGCALVRTGVVVGHHDRYAPANVS
jgi:hypothetical protein